jgi:dephospho-CoA kinase
MIHRERRERKLIIGLTGSFGAGKTTVARIFETQRLTSRRSRGVVKVIDADKIARQCIRPGTLVYKRIVYVFTKVILNKNKVIDRRKLAARVFNNRILLLKLNNIVHPQVIKIIKAKIKSSRAKLIVLDAPLLLEAGLKKFVDKLIVVKISRKKQIKRIQKRTALDKADILKRIKFQISQDAKLHLADFVIDNNGTIEETKKQVREIWRKIWKN